MLLSQYLAKRSTYSETSTVKKEHTSKAFIQVHDYITTEVIKNGKVVKLTYLRDMYNNVLIQFEDDAVAFISSYNLKRKIKSYPGLIDRVVFSSCPFKDTLVFGTSLGSM